MIHTVQYSGLPRALNAIRVVTDTLIENGAEIPEPRGPTPDITLDVTMT